ncbi:unnamed protein product, partial [Urochloa humidicola]
DGCGGGGNLPLAALPRLRVGVAEKAAAGNKAELGVRRGMAAGPAWRDQRGDMPRRPVSGRVDAGGTAPAQLRASRRWRYPPSVRLRDPRRPGPASRRHCD